MATEVGGMHIGVVWKSDFQRQSIDDFFHKVVGGNALKQDFHGGGVTAMSLHGGQEHVTLIDRAYNPAIYGTHSGESLIVQTEKDTKIVGDRGDNTLLIADDANHKVKGAGGNDDITIAGDGNNVIHGGSGNDRIIASHTSGNNHLYGNNGRDYLEAGGGRDTLDGGTGNDVLVGGKGYSVMLGGDGRDNLIGGEGGGIMKGGTGNDTIVSGSGDEVMAGGQGHDIFIFNDKDFGHDTIRGFSKDDILRIADRNGDGFNEGNDFSITQQGRDTVIVVHNENGPDSVITLKNIDANQLKQTDHGQGSEGIFTIG